MWKVWGCAGSLKRGQEEREMFAKPDICRQMADYIRAAHDREIEATDHIERALERGTGHQTSEAPFRKSWQQEHRIQTTVRR